MPRYQKDPGSFIPKIQDPGSWRILNLIFSISRGILETFDPVTATLSWDPRDLGSLTEKMLLDLGILDSKIQDPNIQDLGILDPGCLGKLPWGLVDLVSPTTIMSMYLLLEDYLHPIKFRVWFPMSMRCLNLRTVQNFNHILIQTFCIDLKMSSPCGFLLI